MRRLTLLSLAILGGCNGSGRSANAHAGGNGVASQGAPVSPEQRAAVEDTIRKLNAFSMAAQSRRDLNALMQLMPDTGLVAISGGMMFTDADSLRGALRQAWTAPWLRDLKVTNELRRIDVLSPDAAVVTMTSTTVLDSAGLKQTFHNVWTGLWTNRGGRWVVPQQQSTTIPPEVTPADSQRGRKK
ncbi:MAG: nuclear transport factor 2 family protein [Gemmatimonadales bacterium]